MKVQFLEPRAPLSVDVVADAVSLAGGAGVPRAALDRLTELELLLVYDWAMREHLGASGARIQRRARPSFLEERSADLGMVTLGVAPGEVASGPESYQVAVSFVLRLPAGLPPPTPTREAVDAAALAVAGPPFEVLSGLVHVVPLVGARADAHADAVTGASPRRPRRSRRGERRIDRRGKRVKP